MTKNQEPQTPKEIGKKVRNDWCQCQVPSENVYYERDSGYHGWACSKCWGITQTG